MTSRHHPTRRTMIGLTSVIALVAGLLTTVAAPATAEPLAGAFARPFTAVYSDTTAGDIISRGNSVMTCADGSSGWVASGVGPACADVQAGTAKGQNNYFDMVYVDLDNDGTTFNSSMATVTIPDGATVAYAGLTWAGITSAGKYTPTTGPNPGVPVLVGAAAPDPAARNTVRFLVPGTENYATVTSTQTDVTGSKYQAYADVTSQVQAAGSGGYMVANVQAGTGGNVYAGWSLTVAYELPSLPQRHLVVYTGYGQVDPSGSDLVTVDAPLTGLVTPTAGPVVSRLGVVAFDGDRDVRKEGLRLGDTTISNGLNPPDDVFNSSVTDLNVPVTDVFPAAVNLFGVDIDRYQTVGALATESTGATVHFDTTGDGYYPGVITLATDLADNIMTATKTVTDVNGGDLERGDTLLYTITVQNGAIDGALGAVVTDSIPAGTTYVPDSLVVGERVSDVAGDDIGEVIGGIVTARIGAGASSTVGGNLEVNASVEVTFEVTVDESATESATFTNAATVSYRVLADETARTIGSNTVSSSLYVPPVLTFNPTVTRGEVGLAYSKELSHTGGTAPFSWSVSTGALPAGLTLDAATGVISGTPTAAGTATFTIEITDAVSNSDTQDGTLTIVEQPVIKSGTPLPEGATGTAYNKQLAKSGGISPFTWSVTAGSLPAGLTMDAAGLISGTPTAGGTASFTIALTDGRNVVASKDFTLKVLIASTTTLTTSAATTEFGSTVTLTATVTPANATGKVHFTVVPTTGPQAGQTVQLGTNVLTGGVTTKTVTLPAFGANPVVATYEGNTGNRTWAGSTSAPSGVEVTGFSGQLIATQFRFSGPGGADDSYIQLYNNSLQPVPLTGFVISTTSGTNTTLPAGAGTLAAGRSYLIAGEDYSLTTQAAADLAVGTLGSGGLKILAPDTAGTQTDAVGPATGFHSGTPLPEMTGSPTDQYAWVRLQSAGAPVNTGDNLADFHLVSAGGGSVGGVDSALGQPAPTSTTAPVQSNAKLPSTVLDTGVNYRLPPNRSYTPGSPGTLIIRRTITNSSSDYISLARLRVTSISQVGGAPQPGVVTQPTTVAHLRVIDPGTATSEITTTTGTVTVRNLSLDSQSGVSGGGLNSTLTIPLPDGGLPPGGTVSFAVTLAVDSTGSFWFGYDVDATLVPG